VENVAEDGERSDLVSQGSDATAAPPPLPAPGREHLSPPVMMAPCHLAGKLFSTDGTLLLFKERIDFVASRCVRVCVREFACVRVLVGVGMWVWVCVLWVCVRVIAHVLPA